MPPKVKSALDHVRSIYPDVCLVVFNSDTRWCYMNDVFDSPTFDDRINVGILEDAIYDLVDLPCVFEIVDD